MINIGTQCQDQYCFTPEMKVTYTAFTKTVDLWLRQSPKKLKA